MSTVAVQMMDAEMDNAMALVVNAQSDSKVERDNLKVDLNKDYYSDSEGPSKFQKRHSTRLVIRPSKFNP